MKASIIFALTILVTAAGVGTLYGQQANLQALQQKLKASVPGDTAYVNTLNELANAYQGISADSMIAYARRALDLSQLIGYNEGIARSFHYFGVALLSKGMHNSAMAYFFEILDIQEALGNKHYIADAYHNIALIYQNQENYGNALDYNSKALELRLQMGNDLEIAKSYDNLGAVHQQLADYDKALEYYQKSLGIKETYTDAEGTAFALNNIGNIYTSQQNYLKALDYLIRALQIRDKYNNVEGIIESSNDLAEVYIYTGNEGNAKKLLNRAGHLAFENDNKSQLQNNYYLHAILYEKKGNYRQSLEWYRKFKELQDKIFNEKKSLQMAEMQAKYQSEKKEAENAMLKRQQEISQSVIRLQSLAGIATFLVLASVVVLAITQYRSKKRQQQVSNQLRSQKAVIQEKNDTLATLNNEITSKSKALNEQKENLQSLNHLKDKLLSIISHDVRSPLTSLSGTLELASHGILTNEEIKGIIPELKEKVNNTAYFIDNLLHWAKCQMQGFEVIPESFNVHNVANENVRLLKPIAEAKGVKLVNTVESHLHALADPEMMKLVIRNLVSNAIKFTDDGDTIDISCKSNGTMVTVTVTDTGIGIATKDQNKILNDAYFTKYGTKNEMGTGLGLLLCREFVEKNGGKLSFKSVEGQGTSFSFTIPKQAS